MGNAVIDAQLHHFGIHHNQADLFGLGLVEQGDNQAVHTHGLTGTGGTGDEHVGQSGDVADDALAADVLAHGKGDAGFALMKLQGIDDIPDADRGDQLIGHLDAHHGDFVGNGGNPHTGGAQSQGNVVGQIGDLAELHAPVQLQLIAGDGRAADDVDNVGIDAEAHQGIVEPFGVDLHFLGAVHHGAVAGIQQLHRREGIGLGLIGGLGDLRSDLHGLLLGLLPLDLLGQIRIQGQQRLRLLHGLCGHGVEAALALGDRRRRLRFRFRNDFRFWLRNNLRFRLRNNLRFRHGRHGQRFFLRRHRRRLRFRRGFRRFLHLGRLHGLIQVFREEAGLLLRLLFRLPGLGLFRLQRRGFIHRQIKFRDVAPLSLHPLDLLLGHTVHQNLRRIGMLLRGGRILCPGAILDRPCQTEHRHVEAGQQGQQQHCDGQQHSADFADNQLQEHGQESRQYAAGFRRHTGVPQLAEHGKAPFNLRLAAPDMGQDAHAQGHRKGAGHPQAHRTAIVEQQNYKVQQQGEGHHIDACANDAPQQPDGQGNKHRVHPEQPQQGEGRQEQAHKRADFPPDGFPLAGPGGRGCTGARGFGLSGGLRTSRTSLLFSHK